MIQATAPMVPMNHGWRMNSFISYQVPPRASTILTSPLELPPPGEGLAPTDTIPAAEEKKTQIMMTINNYMSESADILKSLFL